MYLLMVDPNRQRRTQQWRTATIRTRQSLPIRLPYEFATSVNGGIADAALGSDANPDVS